MYVLEPAFNTIAGMQSTAYHRIKDCTTVTFGSFQKGNNVLKFCKFCKYICETVSFSLRLQPWNPEFLTSLNTGPKKNVSFECSEIVKSLPEEVL